MGRSRYESLVASSILLCAVLVASTARAEGRRVALAGLVPERARPVAASVLLRRWLTATEREALLRAHRVGAGQRGRDGMRRAGILLDGRTNYTFGHIREKVRILRQGGFTRAETRRLLDRGVAGKLTREELAQLCQSQCPDVAGAAQQLEAYLRSGTFTLEDVDPAVVDFVKWQVQNAREVGGMAGFQTDEPRRERGSFTSFFRRR